MPNNIEKLYQNLKADGYQLGSLDKFSRNMSDSTKADKLYQNLSADGYQLGSREDFFGKIRPQAEAKPQPTQQPAAQPQNPYKPTEIEMMGYGMTLGNARYAASNATKGVDQIAKNAKKASPFGSGNVGLGNNGNLRKGKQTFDAEKGAFVETYLTSDGREFRDAQQATQAQNELDYNADTIRYQETMKQLGMTDVSAEKDKSIDQRLKEAYAERMELQRQMSEIAKRETTSRKSPRYPSMVGGAAENYTMSEDSKNLSSALRLLERRITALEAERDDEGQSMFWRGTADTLKDPTAYSLGLTDLADTGVMSQLKKKMDAANGDVSQLSDSEKALVRNYMMNQEAQRLNENRGAMYGFGQMFGQSLPFMAEFYLTGGFAGVGTLGTRLGTKAGLKMAGSEIGKQMTKNLGGRILLKTGQSVLKGTGRVGGALAGGVLQSNTIGAAKTYSDIANRNMGTLTINDKGNLDFKDGEGIAEAFLKGQLTNAFENGSELLGPAFDFAPNYLARVIKNKVGGGAVNKLLSSKAWRGTNKVLQKLGVQGLFGEGMEEEANGLANAIIGESNWFKDPNDPNKPAFFDGEEQFRTWEGVALTGAVLRGPAIAVGGYQKAQYYANRYNLNSSDRQMRSVLGDYDRYDAIKSMLDGATNANIGSVLNRIVRGGQLNNQEKEAVVMYAQDLVNLRGFNIGSVVAEAVGAQAQPRVASYVESADGKSFDEVDENGNVLAHHEYETKDDMKAALYEAQQQRYDHNLQSDLGVMRARPNGQYNAFLEQYCQEIGVPPSEFESMLATPSIERTDAEQQLVAPFAQQLHDIVYDSTMLHEGQSRQDGEEIADADSIDINESTNEQGTAIIAAWEAAQQKREQMFAADEDLRMEVESREKDEKISHQEIISALTTFRPEEVEAMIDYYNQKARYEGYMNRKNQKIDEEAHNSRERHTMKGTIDGVADVSGVHTITDGTNRYYLVSGDITTDHATGRITGSTSGLIIGMDLDGSFVQLSETDGYVVEPVTQTLDQFEEAERLRLQEQISATLDPVGAEAEANGEFGQPKVGVSPAQSGSLGSPNSEGQAGTENTVGAEITNGIGRSLTEDESQELLRQMEQGAEVAPELPLTPDNWLSQFGEQGKVNSPIGEVTMGENQYFKLAQQGREGKLGMVKPTLENPDVIIEEERPAKDGNQERSTSYVFVKTFTKADGTRYYYFTSVTVSKDGHEVVISNQEKSSNRISRLLQQGKVVWTNSKFSSHPNTRIGEPVPLNDSNKPTTTDNQPALLGINSSEPSAGKGTDNSSDGQEIDVKTDENGVKLYEQGIPVDAAIQDMQNDGYDPGQYADLAISEAQEELDKMKEPKTRAELVTQNARKKELQNVIDYYQALKERWAAIISQQTEQEESEENVNNQPEQPASGGNVVPSQPGQTVEEQKQERIKALKAELGELFDDDFTKANDVSELVSMWIGRKRNLAWDDVNGKRGLQKELGWTRKIGGDTKYIETLLAKKGEGMGVDEFVHMVWESPENSVGEEKRWTTEEIKEALLELLRSAGSKSDVVDYAVNTREQAARAALEAQQQAEGQQPAEDDFVPLSEEELAEMEANLPFAPPVEGEDIPDSPITMLMKLVQELMQQEGMPQIKLVDTDRMTNYEWDDIASAMYGGAFVAQEEIDFVRDSVLRDGLYVIEEGGAITVYSDSQTPEEVRYKVEYIKEQNNGRSNEEESGELEAEDVQRPAEGMSAVPGSETPAAAGAAGTEGQGSTEPVLTETPAEVPQGAEQDEYLQPRNEKERQIIADVEAQLQQEIDAAIKARDKSANDLQKAQAKESDRATDIFSDDEAFQEPGQLFSFDDMGGTDRTQEGVNRRTEAERNAFEDAKKKVDQLQSEAERNSRIRGALDNERRQTSFDDADPMAAIEQAAGQFRQEQDKELGITRVETPEQQADKENADKLADHPLTTDEIDGANISDVQKTLAKAYLDGNHGVLQTAAYLNTYNDVRNRRQDGTGDSQDAGSRTQLDSRENQPERRPGRVGESDLGMAETEGAGQDQGRRLRVEDGEGQLHSSDGTRGDRGVSGTEPAVDGVHTGSVESVGGSEPRVERPDVRRTQSDKGGSGDTGKPAAGSDAAISASKQRLAELRKRFKKAGHNGELSISLVGMNNEQIGILGEIITESANLGYQYIAKGLHEFNGWRKQMWEDFHDWLAEDMKWSDADIDDYMKEVWNCEYNIDGVTRTIGEWASFIGQEKMREVVREDLGTKYEKQMAAEGIEVKTGDIDNIRETLPYLLPEQQEDVLKAETQFFDEGHQDRLHGNGKGMMFTNGTGTGKTFTGLGIVKRFVKQGKGRVLILTPSQEKVTDWAKDGLKLGLQIEKLDDIAKATGTTATKSKGKGVVVTTYANARQNLALLEDCFDLIVYDESHKITEGKEAAEGEMYKFHQMLTNKDVEKSIDRQTYWLPEWIEYRDLFRERNEINQFLELGISMKDYKAIRNGEVKDRNVPKEMDEEERLQLNARLMGIQNRFEELRHIMQEIRESKREQAEIDSKRTKAVFLSATPFNRRENLKYAEGYLFCYPEEDKNTIGSYNHRSPQDAFLEQTFPAGYRWRYGRLEEHTSNQEALNRQEVDFSDYLQNQLGTLSGRMIASDYDYSRDFPVLTLDNAGRFNQAMSEVYRNRKYQPLADIMRQIWNYNDATALFEAMKTSLVNDRIKEHLNRGQKVVVFHRRRTSGDVAYPFARAMEAARIKADKEKDGQTKQKLLQAIKDFEEDFKDIFEWEKTIDYTLPREQIEKRFGKNNVAFFSGEESKTVKHKSVEDFMKDNGGKDIIVIQEASGKEGISLHDQTGEHQRVEINLALPQSPIAFIQIEGRIYRIGQKSNAIFEYPLLGLDLETSLFAQQFNSALGTTENLALGSKARNLRKSIANSVLENTGEVDYDRQGFGGKDMDGRVSDASDKDGFDLSIQDYYGNQKMQRGRDNREGVDYFPTPEPIGYKMVEWAQMVEGETALEPSAGHGAIARYVPETNGLTAIEPSASLFNKLQMRAGGSGRRFEDYTFEEYALGNKHDVILMNPPYGTGGKTAMEHVAKAFKHLNEGGRIVAIIPDGPAMEKRFNAWLHSAGTDGLNGAAVLTGEVKLPDVAFGRAGTNVRTRVVVIDKVTRPQMREKVPSKIWIDLSGETTIDGLFGKIRNVRMPERTIDTVAINEKKAKRTQKALDDNPFTRQFSIENGWLKVSSMSRYDVSEIRLNLENPSLDNALSTYKSLKETMEAPEKLEHGKYVGRSYGRGKDKVPALDAIKDYCRDAIKTLENVTGVTAEQMDRMLREKEEERKRMEAEREAEIERLRAERQQKKNDAITTFKEEFKDNQTLDKDYIESLIIRAHSNDWSKTDAQNLLKRYGIDWETGKKIDKNEPVNVRTSTVVGGAAESQQPTGHKSDYAYKLDKNTRTGEDMHLVAYNGARLSDADYRATERKAKAQGGYYNRFKKAFHFKTEADARKFMDELGVTVQSKKEDTDNDMNSGYSEGEAKAKPQPTRHKENIRKHVESLLNKLGTRNRTTVITSINGVRNKARREHIENMHKQGKKVYGWFENGRIYLYLPDIDSIYKAEQTIWHETVAHVGLRELLGADNYGKLLNRLWMQHKDGEMGDWVTRRMQVNGWSLHKAIDEWLAREAEKVVAERQERRTLWQKLAGWVGDILREIGYRTNPTITDVRYLFWLSENQLREGEPMSAIKRAAFLHRLERENRTAALQRSTGRGSDMDAGYSEDIDDPLEFSEKAVYDERLNRVETVFTEAYQDSMIALKTAQNAIAHDKAIPDSQNAYMAENLMHGKNKNEMDLFNKMFRDPLIDTINKIMDKVGMNWGDIDRYVYTKSGLERNREFFVRDWLERERSKSIKSYDELHPVAQGIYDWMANRIETDFEDGIIASEEEKQKKLEQAIQKAYQQWLDDIEREWNEQKSSSYADLMNNAITFADYLGELTNFILDNIDGEYNPSENDYSGFRAMYGDENGKYDEDAIIDELMNTEDAIEAENVDTLWKQIQNCTRYGLERYREAGMRSDEQIDRVEQMFHWYVPMRGFKEDKGEDMYQYFTGKDKAKNYVGGLLKHAKGRGSEANYPISTIFAMTYKAISDCNQNLVNQKLYRLCQANPNDLVELSDSWAKLNEQTGEWEEVAPEIGDDMDEEEIREATLAFEEEMRQLAAENKAQKIKGKEHFDYKPMDKKKKSEHIVDVRINGQQKRMIVVGNPRMAQALNGQLRFEHGRNVFSKWNATIKNFMASVFTSYSPTFALRNMFRDWTHFRTMLGVREGHGYASQANKYYRQSLFKMVGLFKKYREGRLDESVEMERDFKDFMDNGGITGFVFMQKLDDIQKDMEKLYKQQKAGKAIRLNNNLWEKILGAVEALNEGIENNARFATYRASRHYAGRTKARSAYDAKEITVNFNRKGAGSKTYSFKSQSKKVEDAAKVFGVTSQVLGEGRIFFNATVQAIATTFKNFQNADGSLNKGYIAKWAGKYALPPFMFGLALPLINKALAAAFGGDGDDDPYANLPEWTRRRSLCFYIGHGNFITIPIGQELAAFLTLGDIAAGNTYAPDLKPVDKSWDDEIVGVMNTFSPVDISTKITKDGLMEDPISEVTGRTFSVLAPLVAVEQNLAWTGRPIYREDRFGNDQYTPEYQMVYSGTNPVLVNATKLLHEIGGGDDIVRGKFEVNPAIIQYLWEQYTGGPGKVFSNTISIGKDAKDILSGNESDFNIRKVEGLKAFVQQGDDRTEYYRANAKYRKYKADAERLHDAVKGYEGGAAENPEYVLKLEQISKGEDFVRMQIVREADKQLSKINKAANKAEGAERKELRRLYNQQVKAVVDMLDSVGE